MFDGIKSGMQLGSRNLYVGGIGLLTDEGSAEELVFDVSSQSAEYATSWCGSSRTSTSAPPGCGCT